MDFPSRRPLEAAQTGWLRPAAVGPASLVPAPCPGAEALHERGMAAFQQGRLEAAIGLLRQALVLKPHDADVYNNLGIMLQQTGNLSEAIASFQHAIQLRPDFAPAFSNLSYALTCLGQHPEAEAHCRTALRLQPDYADAYLNLGTSLVHQARPAEAATCYREALRLKPNFLEAHLNLGHLCQEQGQFAAARAEYEAVLRLNPREARALVSLTATKRYAVADHAELARIEALLDDPLLSVQDRSFLNFAAGKICDDCGLFDKAFRHFQRANEALIRPPWDRSSHAAHINQIMAAFPRSRFAAPCGRSEPPPVPIFIVGMPRSGTSLVEQIVASHPEVHGGGEVNDVGDLVAWLPMLPGLARSYPECLQQLPANLLVSMAEWYRARRRATGPAAAHVTDKMPANLLHLGLIALLFPGARVIHCRREPLDVCLSCYFQNFARRPPYAFDLGDLGFAYRQSERLMAHWKAVLPLPILEVQYEELVQDVAAGTRRLLEFLGLSWNERCLRYYETERAVRTSSSWQVRQSVYTSSVGRWKNYARHLEPLRRVLER